MLPTPNVFSPYPYLDINALSWNTVKSITTIHPRFAMVSPLILMGWTPLVWGHPCVTKTITVFPTNMFSFVFPSSNVKVGGSF